jgi:hypothetical protein
MRLNSTNNKFVFNFPVDFIEDWLYDDLQNLMDKNFIPYETVLEYLNSTIKEIVFPGQSFDTVEQTLKRGKKVAFKSTKNIYDTFTNEIDITFRSVDSNMNYFILSQLLTEFYLNNDKHDGGDFSLDILDHHGDKIYTIMFQEILLKSISENRMGYQMFDISEKTFSITFRYNWLKIVYELPKDSKSKEITDIPIDFKPGNLDLTKKGGTY